MKKPIRLCRIVTVPSAVLQIKTQLEDLVDMGFDVTIVSSPSDSYGAGGGLELMSLKFDRPIRRVPMEIPRDINIFSDLTCLWQFYKFFRKEKFDIVHSMTPKAGLLTAMAGFVARVPIRIHTFTGQRWVSLTGPLRWLLRQTDKLTATLMTHIYADGPGQADFLCSEGLTTKSKMKVVLEGSVAGVDLARFNRENLKLERGKLRQELKLPNDATVVVFVGRLTIDKGIVELVDAFERALEQGSHAELLLLGPFENDLLKNRPDVVERIKKHPHMHAVGFKTDVERYLACSDFMVLPSYREGFGVVVIQAAAMGLPTIGSDIYALRDFIKEGETGSLVAVQDTQALVRALRKFFDDPNRVRALGEEAYRRVKANFDSKVFNKAVGDEYKRVVEGRV